MVVQPYESCCYCYYWRKKNDEDRCNTDFDDVDNEVPIVSNTVNDTVPQPCKEARYTAPCSLYSPHDSSQQSSKKACDTRPCCFQCANDPCPQSSEPRAESAKYSHKPTSERRPHTLQPCNNLAPMLYCENNADNDGSNNSANKNKWRSKGKKCCYQRPHSNSKSNDSRHEKSANDTGDGTKDRE